MTTAVIVQAQTDFQTDTSPVLADLGGRTVLNRVLDRCASIPGVDSVICSIPETELETSLALEVLRAGHCLSVGPAGDALANLSNAAKDYHVDTVVRVGAEAAFVDAQLAGRVLELLHDSRADFATNAMPTGYPRGLEVEVIPAVLLHKAHDVASSDEERADPTLWMRQHAYLQKANLRGPGGALEALDWRVSSADGVRFARAIFDELGEGAAAVSAAELAALCLRRPDLQRPAEHAGEVNPVVPLQAADIESAIEALRIAA